MQNQASVTLVFERVVNVVRSMSVIKQVSPLLFVIVAWGILFTRPTVQTDGSFSFVSGLISPAKFFPTISTVPNLMSSDAQAGIVQVKPALLLTKEQKNLVVYLSAAYGVDVEEMGEYISTAYSAAKTLRVDPLLVLAIMSIESSFDPDAQSHAGAQGLMQVLTRVHADKFMPFGGVKAAFDVRANILVGTQIIQEYIKREGTVESALKSYVGAALMSDDGGYGWKVLGQRTRLQAVALGKPIPKIADPKSNGQASSDQNSGEQNTLNQSHELGSDLRRHEHFYAAEEGGRTVRASFAAQPSSHAGTGNPNNLNASIVSSNAAAAPLPLAGAGAASE